MNVLDKANRDLALAKWRSFGGWGPVPAIANCGAGEYGEETQSLLAVGDPVVELAAQHVAERQRHEYRLAFVNAALNGAATSGQPTAEAVRVAFVVADSVLAYLDREGGQTTPEQP